MRRQRNKLLVRMSHKIQDERHTDETDTEEEQQHECIANALARRLLMQLVDDHNAVRASASDVGVRVSASQHGGRMRQAIALVAGGVGTACTSSGGATHAGLSRLTVGIGALRSR